MSDIVVVFGNANLDNIHVKYAAEYVNIAGELGDGGRCKEHDGGASCVLPLG